MGGLGLSWSYIRLSRSSRSLSSSIRLPADKPPCLTMSVTNSSADAHAEDRWTPLITASFRNCARKPTSTDSNAPKSQSASIRSRQSRPIWRSAARYNRSMPARCDRRVDSDSLALRRSAQTAAQNLGIPGSRTQIQPARAGGTTDFRMRTTDMGAAGESLGTNSTTAPG